MPTYIARTPDGAPQQILRAETMQEAATAAAPTLALARPGQRWIEIEDAATGQGAYVRINPQGQLLSSLYEWPARGQQTRAAG